MKVLKKGRQQKGWSTETHCTGAGNDGGGCGAKLLVEQGDLYKTYRHSWGETEEFVTFKCVDCGVETDLPRKNLPPHDIVAELPDKRRRSSSTDPL